MLHLNLIFCDLSKTSSKTPVFILQVQSNKKKQKQNKIIFSIKGFINVLNCIQYKPLVQGNS
jgi:hypothetical protein